MNGEDWQTTNLSKLSKMHMFVALVDHAPPVRVHSIFNFFQQQKKKFSCDRDLFTLKDLTLDIYRT